MATRDRLQVAVTPPGRNTEAFRRWLEGEAQKQGYIDLKWEEDIDRYGQPMSRLTGMKKSRARQIMEQATAVPMTARDVADAHEHNRKNTLHLVKEEKK